MPRTNLGGTYMVPEIPDFNWESLERASGLTFTEPQRRAFAAAMHKYLRCLTTQRQAVQIKDVKHHCKKILKHAEALIDLLSLHIKNAPSDEDQINFHQAVFSVFPPHIDSSSYLRLIIQLRIGATVALQNLSKKGRPGRQDKEALDVTIHACHAIYVAAGGQGFGCTRSGGSGTAKGPFLALIHEALRQIRRSSPDNPAEDDIPESKNALAQRILIALKQPEAR
jgi:hypothetical protein